MRCGRSVLPSLRGDREEEKQGLERQATGKKRKKKRRTHLVSPPPFDCCVLDKIAHFASPPGQIAQAIREEVPLPRPYAPAQEYGAPYVPS